IGDVSSAELPGYTRSYFPRTADPGEAQYVSVGLSEDVEPIDLSLVHARTAHIVGRIYNAAGQASTGGSVLLMASLRAAPVTSVPVGARIGNDGRFDFPNVPVGEYVIKADRGRPNAWTEGEFGTLPVTVVGSNVTNLVLQTS